MVKVVWFAKSDMQKQWQISHLCEVELQWVICRQTDTKSTGQILG